MKNEPQDDPIQSLHQQKYPVLVGYAQGMFPAFSIEDAEDLATDAFVYCQKYGNQVSCGHLWSRLLVCVRHGGIDLVRKRARIVHGGGKITSLDQILEAGLDPQTTDCDYHDAADALRVIDRVFEMAVPFLNERELIVAKYLRKSGALELTLDELTDELTLEEFVRFLPVRSTDGSVVAPEKDVMMECEELRAMVKHQLSRTKSLLQFRLRQIRDSLKGI